MGVLSTRGGKLLRTAAGKLLVKRRGGPCCCDDLAGQFYSAIICDDPETGQPPDGVPGVVFFRLPFSCGACPLLGGQLLNIQTIASDGSSVSKCYEAVGEGEQSIVCPEGNSPRAPAKITVLPDPNYPNPYIVDRQYVACRSPFEHCDACAEPPTGLCCVRFPLQTICGQPPAVPVECTCGERYLAVYSLRESGYVGWDGVPSPTVPCVTYRGIRTATFDVSWDYRAVVECRENGPPVVSVIEDQLSVSIVADDPQCYDSFAYSGAGSAYTRGPLSPWGSLPACGVQPLIAVVPGLDGVAQGVGVNWITAEFTIDGELKCASHFQEFSTVPGVCDTRCCGEQFGYPSVYAFGDTTYENTCGGGRVRGHFERVSCAVGTYGMADGDCRWSFVPLRPCLPGASPGISAGELLLGVS